MKGFLTIAIGSYYRYLAENLAISYRIHNGSEYPLAVVTDEITPKLEELFDEVIERKKYEEGFLVKLDLYNMTNFDETIFIDADSLIIGDISYLWKSFGESNCDVSALGGIGSLHNNPDHFFDYNKVKEKFGISEFPIFNGGVYYFKKTSKAREVFKFANSLVPMYEDLGIKNIRGIGPGDEALMSIAMSRYGCYAIPNNPWEGMFWTAGLRNIKINVLRGYCQFEKYGTPVEPDIIHFGTNRTYTYIYKREVKLIRAYYWHPGSLWKTRCKVWLSNLWYRIKVLRHRVYRLKPLNLRNLTPFYIDAY